MFDWITDVIAEGGYLAIAFLMLVENVFPPIPSELVMPLAGFVAAQGELNPILVVPAGMTRMPLAPFLLFSAAGTLGWTSLLTAAGFLLEAQYRVVGDYLNIVTNVIIGLVAASRPGPRSATARGAGGGGPPSARAPPARGHATPAAAGGEACDRGTDGTA